MDKNQVINGWNIISHPSFDAQIWELTNQVEALKKKHPDSFHKKVPTKLLSAIIQVIRRIAEDPASSDFRQGTTLGDEFRHWRRAKFLQQFRLFFRYSDTLKVIILCWVNDENTLRAYESKTDAYKVFRTMLKKGNPPDDWKALMAHATARSEK